MSSGTKVATAIIAEGKSAARLAPEIQKNPSDPKQVEIVGIAQTAPARPEPAALQIPVAVPGQKAWAQSVHDTVKEKLMSDKSLGAQWRDVSATFARIYRDPQAAASAMKIEAVMEAPAVHRAVLDRLVAEPGAFGELNGKAGLFASKADKEQRRLAQEGGSVLRGQIERYSKARADAALQLEASETAVRQRVAIDIPALSPAAGAVMERVRDAIDRNDLPAALGFALADRMVKAEIDRVSAAVSQRFGERSLLGIDAKSIEGRAFKAASEGLASDQKVKLAEAWPTLRAVQQLVTHERTVHAVRQVEGLRQMHSSLKAGQ